MNDRVIALYEQALKYAFNSIKREYWDSTPFKSAVAGKFAELIVLECIKSISDCRLEYFTKPQIVNKIKEHLGIE